jgi:MSHA biogenesis protein MshQ
MAGTQLSNRVATRIRKVTTTGFQVTQVHSGNPTNTPSGYDSQEIDFIAVKKGNYQLGGGKAVVIGSESLTNHRRGPNPNNNVNATQSWLNVPFDLPGVPAVLATIQTMNNEFSDGPFPVSKPFMVANTVANGRRLQLALDQGETVANSAPDISLAEKIAYLAITPGSGLLIPPTGSDIGVTYQAIRTPAEIRGLDLDDCKSYTIANNTGNLPLVIGHKNLFSGTDGGWMERCAISNNSVSFSVTEDDFKDGYPGGPADTNHVNERAGILALTGNFADYTNSCGPSIDHFEINTLNAEGLTCEEDTITLKACANADCSVLSTDAVNVNFTVLDDDDVVSFTKTVIITGGEESVNYRYTEIGDASLTLTPVDPQITNDVECADNANLSICDVDFKETGFRFVNGTVNGIVNQNLPVQL